MRPRRRAGRARLVRHSHGIGLAIVAGIAAAAGVLAAEPITLAITRHPLDGEKPFATRVGGLEHRGTIEIKARHSGFGGFSALRVSADGERFVALSDHGRWLSGSFVVDANGWLAGVAGAEIGTLAGLDGLPLASRLDRDAEAMATLPDESVLVGFENRHRIWRYPPGGEPLANPPLAFPAPPGLERAPANQGIEALAALPDGRLLALTEGLRVGDDEIQGWLWQDGAWRSIRYRSTGDYRPTDAAALPGGGVIVVERRFSTFTGLAIRIARIAPDALVPDTVIQTSEIARLFSPHVIDNFEAIAARRGTDGATLLYLIADDNFSPLQRTLIVLFALVE